MERLNASARRRPLACDPCRKRKLRCDRNLPCSMCIRSRRQECSYYQSHRGATTAATSSRLPPHARGHTRSEHADNLSSLNEATLPPEPAVALLGSSSHTTHTPENINNRDFETVSSLANGTWYSSDLASVCISRQLRDARRPTSPSAGFTSTALTKYHSKVENVNKYLEPEQWVSSLAGAANPIKGIICKGQYVGQSHWLQSMMLVPGALKWAHEGPGKAGSELSTLLQDCKVLARQVKLQRQPQGLGVEYGTCFPTRSVCDRLLELYISHFESTHRIVHIPTLVSDYERYWWDGTAVDIFVVLNMQLCLALGSFLYDDTFSLRATVEQWIYEAKTALLALEKAPSSIVRLQFLCLLYFARCYYKGKSGPPIWISGGTIYQAAISLGLHVDPSKLPNMSAHEVEMRRRLWMATLEIVLEASVDAGTPPILSLDDHDCDGPSNLDDGQLDPKLDTVPVACPADIFTNTSLQILFSQSFKLRLKIVKLVNSSSSQTTYGEVLQLTSDLQDATNVMTSQVASYGSVISLFQQRWCELLLRRYFFVLHIPYMQIALNNPLYYFSRKVCVDNAIRLSYCFASPRERDEKLETLLTAANIKHSCDEFLRLHYCAAGSMRTIQLQCGFIMGAELLTLLQGHVGLSTKRRADAEGLFGTNNNLEIIQLHTLLRQTGNCLVHRLRAGHTNVRDYTVIITVVADVEVAMSGCVLSETKHARAVEAFRLAKAILQNISDTSLNNIATELPETSEETVQTDTLWFDSVQDLNWNDIAFEDSRSR